MSHPRHGHAPRSGLSKTYTCWVMLVQRCTNPKAVGYARYGGRGIKVCDRWRLFENFLADMGPKPPGLTIDRKNNDGDYEPNNCRWATHREQIYNRPLRSGAQKLTLEQARVIKNDLRPLKEVAADYGVCIATVSMIRHRRIWVDA